MTHLLPSRSRFAFITVVIVGVLIAQAVRGFGASDRGFPFIGYPMYADAHLAGERLDVHHTVYAVTVDGARHKIDAARDLSIDFWRFERKFVQALKAGKVGEVADHVDRITARYRTVTRLEVEDYPAVLTRDGPRPAPRQIVAIAQVDAGGDARQ